MAAKPVCVILGAGPGNGLAFARRFIAEGYDVAMLARDQERTAALAAAAGAGAHAFACDATDPQSLGGALAAAKAHLGPPRVFIHNAGKFVPGDVMSLSPEAFEDAWRLSARALFLAARGVLPDMLAEGAGAIVAIGATASTRGGAQTAAFAAAKAAERSLAQSLARAYGPKGVHVCHVVIDGVIRSDRAQAMMPSRTQEQFMDPDEIAEAVFAVVSQPKSAWTFELDLRPFNETF